MKSTREIWKKHAGNMKSTPEIWKVSRQKFEKRARNAYSMKRLPNSVDGLDFLNLNHSQWIYLGEHQEAFPVALGVIAMVASWEF